MKTIVVRSDSAPPDVRDAEHTDDVMFCGYHRRYTLGDKGAADPCRGIVHDEFEIDGNLAPVCLPIYLYDHSGLTVAHTPFACKWDSGLLGWHYMTKDVFEKVFSNDREQALRFLKARLEEYDFWLRGECWGFEVTNEDGELGDCFYGYFGDTLEATGMQVDVEKDLQEALVEAWDRRFE
jgi:hypothetical protein